MGRKPKLTEEQQAEEGRHAEGATLAELARSYRPDRASAVPYGQAGENAMSFPHLAHRSADAHKLHSTPQQDGINLLSGNHQTSSRLPAFSLFSRTIAISNEQMATRAWGLGSVPGSINSLPSSHIAPVTRVFISGYSPHRAVVCTTDQWVNPTEVNLAYALPPQAITTVVGCAGGIATDRSENEEPTIRRREVAGLPALLGDCGYISPYKNGQSNNKALWF
jgi:hypothetical protein